MIIGLLGQPEAKKSPNGMLDDSCPLAFEDKVINEGNKRKAELSAMYGEGKDPNKICGTCEYFDHGEEMKACGLKKGEGYCKVWEFKCLAKNTCQSWEAAEEEDESEDDSEMED